MCLLVEWRSTVWWSKAVKLQATSTGRHFEDKRKEQVEEEKCRRRKLILEEIETAKLKKQIQSYIDNLEKDVWQNTTIKLKKTTVWYQWFKAILFEKH